MFVVNASSELLPPFPGGIQLLTDYLIAKKEQKKKDYVRYGIKSKKMFSVVTAILKSETHLLVEFHFSFIFSFKALNRYQSHTKF